MIFSSTISLFFNIYLLTSLLRPEMTMDITYHCYNNMEKMVQENKKENHSIQKYIYLTSRISILLLRTFILLTILLSKAIKEDYHKHIQPILTKLSNDKKNQLKISHHQTQIKEKNKQIISNQHQTNTTSPINDNDKIIINNNNEHNNNNNNNNNNNTDIRIKKEIITESMPLKTESGASSMKSQSVTSSPLLLPTPPCEELEVIEKQIKQDDAVQHESSDFSLLNNNNNNNIPSSTLLNDNQHQIITLLKNEEKESENQVTREVKKVEELVTDDKKEEKKVIAEEEKEEVNKDKQVIIKDKKEEELSTDDKKKKQESLKDEAKDKEEEDKDGSSIDDQSTREPSIASIALSNVPTIITSVENINHDNKKNDIDDQIQNEKEIIVNHDNEQLNKEEKVNLNNITTTTDNDNTLPKLDKPEDHLLASSQEIKIDHSLLSSANEEVIKDDEKNIIPEDRDNNNNNSSGNDVKNVKVPQVDELNLENNEPKIEVEKVTKDNQLKEKEEAIKKEIDTRLSTLTAGSTLDNHPQESNSTSTTTSNSRFLQHAPVQQQRQQQDDDDDEVQYQSFPPPPPIPTVSTNTKIEHHKSSSSLRTNLTSSTSTSSSLSKKIQSKLKSPGRKLTKLFQKKDKKDKKEKK